MNSIADLTKEALSQFLAVHKSESLDICGSFVYHFVSFATAFRYFWSIDETVQTHAFGNNSPAEIQSRQSRSITQRRSAYKSPHRYRKGLKGAEGHS